MALAHLHDHGELTHDHARGPAPSYLLGSTEAARPPAAADPSVRRRHRAESGIVAQVELCEAARVSPYTAHVTIGVERTSNISCSFMRTPSNNRLPSPYQIGATCSHISSRSPAHRN